MVRCKRDEKGELLLPSAGGELLPPPAGGPPPSKREVFGEGYGGRRNGQVSLRGAKGDRGDRKAPICNRQQGRRAWPTGEPGGVEKGNVSTGDGQGTPSTACGRSPSLEEGGLWGGVRGTSKYRREGAKGDRGDRKAPIYNRRQGRRAWPTGEPGGAEKGNFFTGDGRGTPSTACGRSPSLEEGGLWGEVRGTRSARPRGLGGDFEFLPLESPRNPITPIETSRVSTLHPGLYKRLREGA